MGNSEKLAIQGGVPVRGPEKRWPEWPIFDESEKQALLDVLESREWFYGSRVKRFEEEYAAFQGAKYCVTANSGTAAIEVGLQALGIGCGTA